jgi:hypothetical protein
MFSGNAMLQTKGAIVRGEGQGGQLKTTIKLRFAKMSARRG